jgi:hypothetical protein
VEEGAEQQRPADTPTGRRSEPIVLASGNLGLVSFPDVPHRMTREEIDARHPRLLPTLRAHPHVGFVVVHSELDGPVVLGAKGLRHLGDDRVEGEDPLASFSPRAADHLRRWGAFEHPPRQYGNTFYDAELAEGCAFEELISFHGGMGGPQTQAFVLAPVELPLPDEPIVGAASVHRLLKSWRFGEVTVEVV